MERTTQSSNKRQQVSDESQNVGSIDRISGLPDAVICHILSFLPTKFSVATSILSRRWRFMWAHVPNLVFDYDEHFSETSLTSFSSIINRVMLLHKVRTIETFCLYGDGLKCSDYDLETWIATLIERNVEYLEIGLNPEFSFMLPRCIFTCKTLVGLSLSFCVFPSLSGAIFLPCLKSLALLSVEYVVEEALPRLLSGCPVLQDLTINTVQDPAMFCLNISSPTINWLSVKGEKPNYALKINAPALRYFQISDCSCEHILFSRPITTLSSLILSLIHWKEITTSMLDVC